MSEVKCCYGRGIGKSSICPLVLFLHGILRSCVFAAALFFTTYESVKGAMGLVGFSSQFSIASLVTASCCGETVCSLTH